MLRKRNAKCIAVLRLLVTLMSVLGITLERPTRPGRRSTMFPPALGSYPRQLSSEELRVVKDMPTSQDHRHVPTGTLAVLAQSLGKVFASSATWYRVSSATA